MSCRDMKINMGRTNIEDGKLSFPMLVKLSATASELLLNAYGIAKERAAEYDMWCEGGIIFPIAELMSSPQSAFEDEAASLEHEEEYRLILPGEALSSVSEELLYALSAGVDIIAFPYLFGPWSRLGRIARGIPEEQLRLDYPMLLLSRIPLTRRRRTSSLPATSSQIESEEPATPAWYFDNRCRVAAYEEWANLYRKGLLKDEAGR